MLFQKKKIDFPNNNNQCKIRLDLINYMINLNSEELRKYENECNKHSYSIINLKQSIQKINEIENEKSKESNDNNNICLKDIDELVEYINSNDIPLKKGKRKKKKNKKNKNLINNNQDNLNDSNLINIKDEIVEDFKYSINEYTSTNYRKIKPNISKDWLCKISELNI